MNRVEKIAGGYRLYPALNNGGLPADLYVDTPLYRNRDQAFERLLEKKSAERRISLQLHFSETATGFALRLSDDRGIEAVATLEHAKETAQNPERALTAIRENLGKLGTTDYLARSIELEIGEAPFLPASALNALRREAVEALDLARKNAYQRPIPDAAVEPPAPYPEDSLNYLGNVFNEKARAFYTKHGVSLIESAYECNEEKGEVSLMITKHCLRYSFKLCPKEVKGLRPDPMTLMNGKEKLTLTFDCKRCEMHVVGKLKKNRTIQLHAR